MNKCRENLSHLSMLLGCLFLIAIYTSAPAQAERKAGPNEPVDFWFLYMNDPKQPQYFVKTGDKSWELHREHLSNPESDTYTLVKRSKEKGFGAHPDVEREGIILLRSNDSNDQESFYPDFGQTDMMGAWRDKNDRKWHSLNVIHKTVKGQLPEANP